LYFVGEGLPECGEDNEEEYQKYNEDGNSLVDEVLLLLMERGREPTGEVLEPLGEVRLQESLGFQNLWLKLCLVDVAGEYVPEVFEIPSKCN
jgi:hypothetical protein